MRSVGVFLVLLGAFGFIYHAMGRQSSLLSVFGEHQQIAASVAIGLGGVLFFLGRKKKSKEEQK